MGEKKQPCKHAHGQAPSQASAAPAYLPRLCPTLIPSVKACWSLDHSQGGSCKPAQQQERFPSVKINPHFHSSSCHSSGRQSTIWQPGSSSSNRPFLPASSSPAASRVAGGTSGRRSLLSRTSTAHRSIPPPAPLASVAGSRTTRRTSARSPQLAALQPRLHNPTSSCHSLLQLNFREGCAGLGSSPLPNEHIRQLLPQRLRLTAAAAAMQAQAPS
jgi:hypothetical protein